MKKFLHIIQGANCQSLFLQKHICSPNTAHHNTYLVMMVQKHSHHMQQWSKKMQLLTERKMSSANQIKVPPTQDQEFERLVSPLN